MEEVEESIQVDVDEGITAAEQQAIDIANLAHEKMIKREAAEEKKLADTLDLQEASEKESQTAYDIAEKEIEDLPEEPAEVESKTQKSDN